MAEECILVVDDDRDIRESLVELLQEHGCAALGAENGRAALQALETMQNERACLILLDLMMPVMDGRSFREEQQRHAELANIPVVVISAFHDLIDEMKAMGVQGYLKKPLKFADVMQAAKKYCGCDA